MSDFIGEDRDTSMYPSNAELRQWAMAINPRGAGQIQGGPIPNSLIVGWNRKHPDRPYVKRENFHGTWEGYANRRCHCERCLETGHRMQASYVSDRHSREEA